VTAPGTGARLERVGISSLADLLQHPSQRLLCLSLCQVRRHRLDRLGQRLKREGIIGLGDLL
jgi:hypothetical protein